MPAFKLTRKAVKDLSEIWEHTLENWSEKQAEKYYMLIIDCCSELARNPEQGKIYFGIYPELYGHRISRHIIFYRPIDKSTIEVTRILHEEMDLKNRLKKK